MPIFWALLARQAFDLVESLKRHPNQAKASKLIERATKRWRRRFQKTRRIR